MGKSLKDQNSGRLLAIVVGNAALFAVFAHATEGSVGTVYEQTTKLVWQLAPAALAAALLAILNGLLTSQAKARLVFWRWKDPLPGNRAFSIHVNEDPRINIDALNRKLPKWPKSAHEQNTTWYGLYRTVESESSVATGHRDFLFARDYAVLSALFVVFLGGLAVFRFHDLYRSCFYIALLTVQYLVVRYVAARYGIGFVKTVLAVKSAEK